MSYKIITYPIINANYYKIMNSAINIVNSNEEVEPLILEEDQVIQTIGPVEIFPHLPKHVRANAQTIRETGFEPVIVVVVPLDNRKPYGKPFNMSAEPEPIYYYVTEQKELRDVGINSRAQVHKECQKDRDIYFYGQVQDVKTIRRQHSSLFAA